MSRRSNPPQGRVDNHDHSEAGRGGDGLTPAAVEVQGSRTVDSWGGQMVQDAQLAGHVPGQPYGVAGMSGPEDMVVAGNILWVADKAQNLFALDISQPGRPMYIDHSGLDLIKFGVEREVIAGYNDSTGDFETADISDPTSVPSSADGSVATQPDAEAVDVVGGYAFAALRLADTLAVYDVSDPSSPSGAGQLATGDIRYATPSDVRVQGDYAYVPTNGGLLSVNVADPEDPFIADRIEVGTPAIEGTSDKAFVRGDYLYMNRAEDTAVFVIDVSDPNAMVQVGSVSDADALARAVGIHARGDFVFSGAVNGVTITDVSDPTSPSITREQISGAAGVYPGTVAGKGDWLFFGDTTTNGVIHPFGPGAAPIDTGTVTATGGASPALDTTISEVSMEETEPHNVVVYVDADPSFDADYAFNYDWGFVYIDVGAGDLPETRLNLTVNWDTDPGAGNDVTLRWEVVRP